MIQPGIQKEAASPQVLTAIKFKNLKIYFEINNLIMTCSAKLDNKLCVYVRLPASVAWAIRCRNRIAVVIKWNHLTARCVPRKS